MSKIDNFIGGFGLPITLYPVYNWILLKSFDIDEELEKNDTEK